MSKTTHTPEPWMHLGGEETIYSKLEDGCRGIPIARVTSIMPQGMANAARIVACVNACAGIEDPEQWIAISKSHFEASELQAAQNDRLKKERDEAYDLLKALCLPLTTDHRLATFKEKMEDWKKVGKAFERAKEIINQTPAEI